MFASSSPAIRALAKCRRDNAEPDQGKLKGLRRQQSDSVKIKSPAKYEQTQAREFYVFAAENPIDFTSSFDSFCPPLIGF